MQPIGAANIGAQAENNRLHLASIDARTEPVRDYRGCGSIRFFAALA
jgi:hypothetical protein